MPKLSIELHPHRAPGLNLQEIRSLLEGIGATPRLVQGVRVDEGERNLAFIFETPDLGALWELIEAEIFSDPPWGRLARRASIVTCEGHLILHHFDPAVPRASVPDQRKGKKSPRCG